MIIIHFMNKDILPRFVADSLAGRIVTDFAGVGGLGYNTGVGEPASIRLSSKSLPLTSKR